MARAVRARRPSNPQVAQCQSFQFALACTGRYRTSLELQSSDDVMPRDTIILSQVVLRFLSLAITLVIGLEIGPQPPASGPSTPVVCSADQKVSEDTLKVGQRLEPRVFPAPFLDRLPPVRPSYGPGAVSGRNEALALGDAASDDRSDGERLPIVKHVPRMERGDPPRA